MNRKDEQKTSHLYIATTFSGPVVELATLKSLISSEQEVDIEARLNLSMSEYFILQSYIVERRRSYETVEKIY